MTPDITGLPFDEIRNSHGDIYMRRYYIHRYADGRSERIHQILLSDEDPHLHDHPWHFTTHLLHGTYLEHRPDGDTQHPTDTTLNKQAHDLHRLTLNDGPVWTHVTTSQYIKTWGFHTNAGWIDHRQYQRPSRIW